MADISTKDLFASSASEGLITPGSATLLTGMAGRIDQTMQPLAVTPKVVEQTLIAVLLDNTPSMEYQGPGSAEPNWRALIASYNLVIEALRGAKAVNSVEILPVLLNPNADYIKRISGGPDFKWKPLHAADLLVPDHDFIHGNRTPLFERAIFTLGCVVARQKWWEDTYTVQARTEVLLVSDGEDNIRPPKQYEASDVAGIVADMLGMESHRIKFWGFQGPDSSVNFRQVGHDMGIKDVGVVPSDASEIRAKFALWSKSMTQAPGTAAGDSVDDNLGFGATK